MQTTFDKRLIFIVRFFFSILYTFLSQDFTFFQLSGVNKYFTNSILLVVSWFLKKHHGLILVSAKIPVD